MKAALLSSKGMGDALIMLVAAYKLYLEGYKVTFFHEKIQEIRNWFPFCEIVTFKKIECLQSFDSIILQNNNSKLSYNVINQYRKNTHVFYSSYEKHKHLPLHSNDFVFDRTLSMVENVAIATAKMLGQTRPIFANGIIIPKSNVFKKHGRRILIHPTSSEPSRSWCLEKFIKLASKIKKNNFEPVFMLSPEERKIWRPLLHDKFKAPFFETIHELANYIYESGFLIGNESGSGHLASNLGIPTLIVAKDSRQMALWRPGFLKGTVITPSYFFPNFKFFRLREKQWKHLIFTSKVFNCFKENFSKNIY